jgi:hypothetical protein
MHGNCAVSELGNALKSFVDKDQKDAIKNLVDKSLKDTQNEAMVDLTNGEVDTTKAGAQSGPQVPAQLSDDVMTLRVIDSVSKAGKQRQKTADSMYGSGRAQPETVPPQVAQPHEQDSAHADSHSDAGDMDEATPGPRSRAGMPQIVRQHADVVASLILFGEREALRLGEGGSMDAQLCRACITPC